MGLSTGQDPRRLHQAIRRIRRRLREVVPVIKWPAQSMRQPIEIVGIILLKRQL